VASGTDAVAPISGIHAMTVWTTKEPFSKSAQAEIVEIKPTTTL
jgi:hypothetical protein